MEWQPLLNALSRHLLDNLEEDELEELRDQVNFADYLGYAPAKIEHIKQTQIRLGFELPNSITSFYLTTNGWHSADGFPVGIANVISVTDVYLLSNCQHRDLEIFSRYVEQTFQDISGDESKNSLENCVVIIDLDGNELGFAVRSDNLDDWPVVTYNPDGGEFETYPGFIPLMKDGLNF